MNEALRLAVLLAIGCGAPCPACPRHVELPREEAPGAPDGIFVRLEGPRGYAERERPSREAWTELVERVGMTRLSCWDEPADGRWQIYCTRSHEGLPLGAGGPTFSATIRCDAPLADGFHGEVQVGDELLTPVSSEHPHGRQGEVLVVRARCLP